MKLAGFAILFCSAFCCISPVSAEDKAANTKPPAEYTPRIDKEGWEILFDGKDLSAWQDMPAGGGWTITDKGELFVARKGQNIFTKRRYCDYVIECDFKVTSKETDKSNSGVFIRTHDMKDTVNSGFEIQILNDPSYGAKWDSMNANGALYDMVHPSVAASSPLGEWNHIRITVNGSLINVELNGKEIVKADLNQWTTPGMNPDGTHNKYKKFARGALPHEGFIGLQNYGGVPVWFKNIRLKTLLDRKPKFTGTEKTADVLQPVGKTEGK